jgi:hypothetical protein
LNPRHRREAKPRRGSARRRSRHRAGMGVRWRAAALLDPNQFRGVESRVNSRSNERDDRFARSAGPCTAAQLCRSRDFLLWVPAILSRRRNLGRARCPALALSVSRRGGLADGHGARRLACACDGLRLCAGNRRRLPADGTPELDRPPACQWMAARRSRSPVAGGAACHSVFRGDRSLERGPDRSRFPRFLHRRCLARDRGGAKLAEPSRARRTGRPVRRQCSLPFRDHRIWGGRRRHAHRHRRCDHADHVGRRTDCAELHGQLDQAGKSRTAAATLLAL